LLGTISCGTLCIRLIIILLIRIRYCWLRITICTLLMTNLCITRIWRRTRRWLLLCCWWIVRNCTCRTSTRIIISISVSRLLLLLCCRWCLSWSWSCGCLLLYICYISLLVINRYTIYYILSSNTNSITISSSASGSSSPNSWYLICNTLSNNRWYSNRINYNRLYTNRWSLCIVIINCYWLWLW